MDRRKLLYSLIVAAAAAAALVTNLGEPRLWDRDEPRNAQCAVEMRARGDWIVPTFNGELRAHKPALVYWLMLASYAALGESELAARLPSALLGIATALVTMAMAWRLFSPRAALWAGLMLATSLSFDIAGRAATPDAALLFCVTGAMAAFVFAATTQNGDCSSADLRGDAATVASPSLSGWIGFYALLGLAVLAKGPVGLVLGAAIIGLFLVIVSEQKGSGPNHCVRRILLPTDCGARGAGRGAQDMGFGRNDAAVSGRDQSMAGSFGGAVGERIRLLQLIRFVPTFATAIAATVRPRRVLAAARQMRPLVLAAVVLAIAAPWYVAVHRATGGAFTDEFFFRHNFERATSAMEGHRGPIVYYLGAGLVGFFPWSIFAVPVAVEAIHVLQARSRERVGVVFALCWAGVWIAAFSLVSTKLPSYITPAYPAVAMLSGMYVDRWLAGTSVAAARWTPWALAALAIIGAGLALGLPLMARHYLPGDEVLGLLGLIPLATAATAWWCVQRRSAFGAAATLAVGATALVVATFGFAQVRVDRRQISEDLVALVRHDGGDVAQLVAFGELEPSMVYYAGRPIATLVDPAEAGALFERNEQAYLLASGEDVAELRRHLPPDVDVIARRPKFLEPGEVVVLARTRETLARRREAANAVRTVRNSGTQAH